MGIRLYVGNLPFDTTEEQLKDAFGKCGEVVESAVIKDKFSGRSRGFAFVEMADQAAADKVCEEFNDKDFGGRNIVVNIAKPAGTRDNDRGGRGRGDRGGDRGGYNRDGGRGDRDGGSRDRNRY